MARSPRELWVVRKAKSALPLCLRRIPDVVHQGGLNDIHSSRLGGVERTLVEVLHGHDRGVERVEIRGGILVDSRSEERPLHVRLGRLVAVAAPDKVFTQ